MIATVERLERWLAKAKPGDRFCYAEYPIEQASSQRSPVWTRAAELCEDGVITLTSGKVAGVWQRWANRIHAPVKRGPAIAPAALAPGLAAVLGEFGRSAAAGRVCPSNREIGDRLGIKAKDVGQRVESLVRRGLIRIDSLDEGRVVTMLSTGKRTAIPA